MSLPYELTSENRTGIKFFLEVFTRLVKENSATCKSCVTEWEKLVQKHPFDVSTREGFYVWTIRMHDGVNKALGKPVFGPLIGIAPWS